MTQLAIADLAHELADPHQHRAQRWGWNAQRNKIRLPDHVTVQPGLVTQLHRAVAPLLASLDNPGTRGVPRSTPPLQIDALDRYLDITVAAATWCRELGVPTRDRHTLEDLIRGLAGATTTDRTDELLADLRRWRNWAATLTGWQHIETPRAWCPVIDCPTTRPGTLRVNLTTQTAICTTCRSWWDETTIGLLAEHIANTTDRQEPIRVRSGTAGHGGWSTREPERPTP